MDNPRQAAIDYAWAAGLFDGEGCICILRTYSKTAKSPSYRLILKMTQVDPKALEKLKQVLGGNFYKNTRTRIRMNGNKVRETYFDWYATSVTASDGLKKMLPYLTLKKERAEVGIEFQSTIKRRGWYTLSKEEVDIRMSLRSKLMLLNTPPTAAQRAASETKSNDSLVGDAIVRSTTDDKGVEAAGN